MSGQYTAYQIFSDWVEMLAISIQNTCWVAYRGTEQYNNDLWQDREKRYLNIASRYTKDQIMTFCKMSGWLTDTTKRQLVTYLERYTWNRDAEISQQDSSSHHFMYHSCVRILRCRLNLMRMGIIS